MAQLRYIWVISSSVTQIKSSDTFGIFKYPSVDNNGKTITIDTDSSVSLSKDRTITAEGVVVPATPTPTVTVTVTPSVNMPPTIKPPTNEIPTLTASEEAKPPAAATTRKTEPGFEAVYAIAGLLAVAFLVLRQRK
jgi:PGF-CTERM protein